MTSKQYNVMHCVCVCYCVCVWLAKSSYQPDFEWNCLIVLQIPIYRHYLKEFNVSKVTLKAIIQKFDDHSASVSDGTAAKRKHL